MTEQQQAAMRMALEALRDYRRSDDDRVSVAMGILQEALAEQPAQQEPFGHVTVRRLSQRFENHHDQYHFYPAGQSPYLDNVDECHPVYTSPQPAQQQEPVAMRYDFDGYGWKYIDSGSGSDWKTRIKGAESIYTSPPASKPWVGLTDEEIKKMHNDLCNTVGSDFKTVARATETKLREKNA